MNVQTNHPKEEEAFEIGKKIFFHRGGPYDFACATCHAVDNIRIRLQDLPNLTKQADAQRAYTSWPAYRVSQGEVRTFQWRLEDCFRQQRFPHLEFASDASIALTHVPREERQRRRVQRASHQALKGEDDMKTKIHRPFRPRRASSPAAPRPRRTRRFPRKALAMMKAGFTAKGQAKLDRLDQDELQRTCSIYTGDNVVPKDMAARIEKAQLATIKFPADGKLLGNWKSGEKIAQSGRGGQFSDDPKQPSGANCYACHQLDKAELSYGTIGPSLYNFAKVRGYGPDIQKYAWTKVYNSHATSACSTMPRFGHQKILTEDQIRDVVALLMDPNSPVNK